MASTAPPQVTEVSPADALPAAPGVPAGTEQPPPPAPSRGASAVRWGGLAILFVAAAEVTCRVEERVRYGTPLLSRAAAYDDLMVVDADGAHGRPNVHFGKWRMNAVGTRGPEVAAAKPAGVLRIVAVGASETFGLYESAGQEYPRQLEDTLRARGVAGMCGGRGGVAVLNAALAGMSLPTIAQDVETRLRRLSPDVVVIYPTPTGYLDNALPRPRAPQPGAAPPLPATRAFRLRFVDRIRNQPKAILPAAVLTWLRRRDTERARAAVVGARFTTVPADRMAAYEADLRRVVGAVRAIGAEPVLGTHANAFMRGGPIDAALLASWERFYPRTTGPTLIAFESAARTVTERVARDSAAAVADIAARLSREPSRSAFVDFSHFTDHGAAVTAAVVAEATAEVAATRCGSVAQRTPRRSNSEQSHHRVGGSTVTAR